MEEHLKHTPPPPPPTPKGGRRRERKGEPPRKEGSASMGFTLTASVGGGVPTGERGTWTRQTAVQMENASKKQTRCNCSRQVGDVRRIQLCCS